MPRLAALDAALQAVLLAWFATRKRALSIVSWRSPLGALAFALVLLALLLGIQPVTTDVYLPALPALQADLRAPMAEVQLTFAALLLAFGTSQLVWGPLSDRFGLWLGFHACNQDDFLKMIRGYCDAFGIAIDDETLRAEAIEWQATRGSRSGRVAWQFFTDLAGRRGLAL